VARELHDHYGLRWSVKRWLRAARGYRAEDLREAARRFDRILLREGFHCDAKRNPRYLLAIIRTIAEESRTRHRRDRSEQKRREKEETHWRAVLDEQRWRDQHPEEAATRALEYAADVFANGAGFGLRVAQDWLDHALEALAQRGEDAYRLAIGRFLASAGDDRLRRWLIERIDRFKPPVTSFCADLRL